MAAQPTPVLGAILIGLGATLAIDLWGLALKRAFGIVSLNYYLWAVLLSPLLFR